MMCYDCVFKGLYEDMGARIDTCRLCDSLPEAVKAADDCRYSGECKYHLTVAEAKKIVEERNNQ